MTDETIRARDALSIMLVENHGADVLVETNWITSGKEGAFGFLAIKSYRLVAASDLFAWKQGAEGLLDAEPLWISMWNAIIYQRISTTSRCRRSRTN